MQHNRKRKGITLIEVLFVLGIMAILIGIVMTTLSMATEREKLNQFKEEILTIGNIGNELSQSQPDFNNVSTEAIAKSHLLPNKYVKGNGLVTPWGGSIDIMPGGDLWMMVNDVPQAACKALDRTSNDLGANADIYTYQCSGTSNYIGIFWHRR